MAVRIVFSIILLLSILFLPFWVSLLLAIVGMVFFPYYLEAVFFLFISDLLYGVPQARYLNITFVSSIISAALFFSIEFFKKRSMIQLGK